LTWSGFLTALGFETDLDAWVSGSRVFYIGSSDEGPTPNTDLATSRRDEMPFFRSLLFDTMTSSTCTFDVNGMCFTPTRWLPWINAGATLIPTPADTKVMIV